MKERPIIFSGDMVRAVLAGTKTQTRRVMKPQPQLDTSYRPAPLRWKGFSWFEGGSTPMIETACPYGVAGDRLWIKEKFCCNMDKTYYQDDFDGTVKASFTSARFMSRARSRITLEILKVRVERLQDISAGDARREGRKCAKCSGSPNNIGVCCCVEHFAARWDSLHGKGAWERNDWCWVIEFRKVA